MRNCGGDSDGFVVVVVWLLMFTAVRLCIIWLLFRSFVFLEFAVDGVALCIVVLEAVVVVVGILSLRCNRRCNSCRHMREPCQKERNPAASEHGGRNTLWV